jgi:hypothetical protein
VSAWQETGERDVPDVNPADRESLLAPSARRTRIGRFTLRQLSILQWVGTLAAPIVWYSQWLFGFGVGQAICLPGGRSWGVNFDVYQLTAMSVAGVFEIVSWACALIVFLHVRGADWGDGPPEEGRWGGEHPYGRLYFFAAAAMVANLLFLTATLLDSTAAVVDVLCRQS